MPMPDFTFKLTYEQVNEIILTELLDYWRMNANEIETLLENKEDLKQYQIEDLEDSLDLRTHLKAVIKYCTTADQRKKKGLTF